MPDTPAPQPPPPPEPAVKPSEVSEEALRYAEEAEREQDA